MSNRRRVRVNVLLKDSQAEFVRSIIKSIEADETKMIEMNVFPHNSRSGKGMTFSTFDNGDTMIISNRDVERTLADYTECPF